jgi:hypothetical protein
MTKPKTTDRDFLVENEFNIDVVAGYKVARPKDFNKCREWAKERGIEELNNNLDKMEVNKKLYFAWFW